jgi:hypothetical protein
MSEKQQRLVLSIIDFLNQSINDGIVREEDKEGLEVAGAYTPRSPLRLDLLIIFLSSSVYRRGLRRRSNRPRTSGSFKCEACYSTEHFRGLSQDQG